MKLIKINYRYYNRLFFLLFCCIIYLERGDSVNTRKSMTFPIIITLLILGIIIYLFTSLKQTEVTCSRVNTYDDNVRLKEEVISMIDSKKIKSLQVTKTVILPEKYTSDDTYLNSIKATLEHTLNYLGDKALYY